MLKLFCTIIYIYIYIYIYSISSYHIISISLPSLVNYSKSLFVSLSLMRHSAPILMKQDAMNEWLWILPPKTCINVRQWLQIWLLGIASKVAVFGDFLVRIQSECGKIRTRKTLNTDTFQAVKITVINRCLSYYLLEVTLHKK